MTTTKTRIAGLCRTAFQLTAFFFAGAIATGSAHATSRVSASVPILTPTANPAANEDSTLYAKALVVQNTASIKLIFYNLASKKAVVIFRDGNGQIIRRNDYINRQRFFGKFDLSPLPDGKYSLEIYASSKAGIGKKVFVYSFEIETQTTRSIAMHAQVEGGFLKTSQLPPHK